MSRAARTVVLVTGHVPPAHALEALLIDTSDFDIVVVELIARSYSRIRQVVPDAVMVSSEIDDVATCRLLSMLKADSCASRIPVLTCVTSFEQSDVDDDFAELNRNTSTQSLAISMN
jgi:hypothetical protein